MCESFLKISIFTFFSDITYETLLLRGFVWNEKKNFFYLIRCWFIFFYLIDKGFCFVCEFVFCNKLDRIRRQNFGTKVASHANIPKSNFKHLTHIRMFWWCWNSPLSIWNIYEIWIFFEVNAFKKLPFNYETKNIVHKHFL